jgi:peptide chain release factor 2
LNSEGIFDLTTKEKELEQLQEIASTPDFWNDSQNAQQVTQQMSSLREDIVQYQKLNSQLEDLQVLVELAIEEDEESLSYEIGAGIKEITAQLDRVELKLMLDGDHDRRNAILYIHPGAGGIDAQDWAAMLMRMYLRWCEQRGYRTEIIELTPAEEAGIKSVTVLVTGLNAYGYLQSEIGIHRLV